MIGKKLTKREREMIKKYKNDGGYAPKMAYSVAIISALEGISPRAIRKAAKAGHLQGKQLSIKGKWRFRGENIIDWLT